MSLLLLLKRKPYRFLAAYEAETVDVTKPEEKRQETAVYVEPELLPREPISGEAIRALAETLYQSGDSKRRSEELDREIDNSITVFLEQAKRDAADRERRILNELLKIQLDDIWALEDDLVHILAMYEG